MKNYTMSIDQFTEEILALIDDIEIKVLFESKLTDMYGDIIGKIKTNKRAIKQINAIIKDLEDVEISCKYRNINNNLNSYFSKLYKIDYSITINNKSFTPTIQVQVWGSKITDLSYSLRDSYNLTIDDYFSFRQVN